MVDTESTFQSNIRHINEEPEEAQNEKVAVAVTQSLRDLTDEETDNRYTNFTRTQRTNYPYSPHTYSSHFTKGAQSSQRQRQNLYEMSQQLHDKFDDPSKKPDNQYYQGAQQRVHIRDERLLTESDNDEIDKEM